MLFGGWPAIGTLGVVVVVVVAVFRSGGVCWLKMFVESAKEKKIIIVPNALENNTAGDVNASSEYTETHEK